MQKDKTLQFWDDFYQHQQQQAADSNHTKEWILQPSHALLEQLVDCFDSLRLAPKKQQHHHHNDSTQDDELLSCTIRLLEIGCGTSLLSSRLWQYWNEQQKHHHHHGSPHRHHHCRLEIVATDVSEVCIQQNQKRHAKLLDVVATTDAAAANKTARTSTTTTTTKHTATLEYRVLNVCESHPDLVNSFDVILDKGCLDTFLFRSKQRGRGSQPYSALVRTVLNNIHSWLRSGSSSSNSNSNSPSANHDIDPTAAAYDVNDITNSKNHGIYLILSPRQRHRSARDYKGFSNVQRIELDLTKVDRGDMEGNNEDRVFLHVCSKNSTYSPTDTQEDAFNKLDNKTPVQDEEMCQTCRITFLEFRQAKTMMRGRCEAFLFRKWRGHCTICKG